MQYSSLTAAVIALTVSGITYGESLPGQNPATPVSCAASLDARVTADIRNTISQTSAAELRRSLDTLISDRNLNSDRCPPNLQLLTQIAVIQLRLGDLSSAQASIVEVLAAETKHPIYSADAGLCHFMLAGMYRVRGDYVAAEREDRRALNILARVNPPQHVAMARIYGDLASLYVDKGDLTGAEAALQNALEAEKMAPVVVLGDAFLRRDALVHLQYREGRVTEALKSVQSMVDDYGSGAALTKNERAHLYRDQGELLICVGRVNEAADSLKGSLALTDPELQSPEYAIVLAMLSEAYSLRKDLAAAEGALREAWSRAEKFEKNFPQDAARISAAYGALLDSEKQWKKARPLLIEALQLGETNTDLEVRALKDLIQADHHLGERQEEGSMRKKLKSSLQAAGRDRVRESTIDVAAFSGSEVHSLQH